ncbi:DUF5339 domain-containing protein [Actinobacillus genomosp. 1]|uniref:DUF5339 domain-containing protein n=1 Tax=Actinobacillus genomosp. 1 TaxID=254839 RepID=UPI002442CF0E|nr:DUF5339 domain-containing protein [Actinobacillus genomosp. 1]WGE34273.1 DUF5339 domain-containing protein [Actinobacillus genomosp. 1]WGE36340.1 DUF5339 domain-containing protein [Actinobacillus genomosp. 1]WGE91666.1 DUF5339 domain-containing protein [Actinobacillus genomosp. 1]
MLKKVITSGMVSAVLIATIQNAVADMKTSSLSMAKPSVSKHLPSQCQQMFSVAHKLVSDAEKQPGTHTQVQKMKNKLSSTKEEILKMETEMQEKSCNKGLTALNTLKQKH